MPEMADEEKVFPKPTRYSHEFEGWFDEEGNEYSAYAETMPESLTLTAKWTYIAPADNSGSGYSKVMDDKNEWLEIDGESTTTLPTKVTALLLDSSYEAIVPDESEAVKTYEAVQKLRDNYTVLEEDGRRTVAADKVIENLEADIRESLDLSKVIVLDPVLVYIAGDAGQTVRIQDQVVFGAAYAGKKLSSVEFTKVTSDDRTLRLTPAYSLETIIDGQYIWTDEDKKPYDMNTTIMKDFAPILTVAVKDGGDYDMDATPNSVLDPKMLAPRKSSSPSTPNQQVNGYEPGGGCDAGLGLGLTGIGLLAAIAAVCRRGKRG
jgi:uncharacterized repeat protein (TIGR02543 family)